MRNSIPVTHRSGGGHRPLPVRVTRQRARMSDVDVVVRRAAVA
jgi:hypothetical protein